MFLIDQQDNERNRSSTICQIILRAVPILSFISYLCDTGHQI